MEFLKYLDVLIGLTVVMIVLSPAVTAITQLFMFVFNRRSRFLSKGLRVLIEQLKGMDTETAQKIAAAVLLHPMIRKAEFSVRWLKRLSEKKKWTWLTRDHSGEVVEREELIRILLEFGAGEGAGKLDEDARKVLVESLKANGIPDPGSTLAAIRAEAQRLEIDKPGAAAHVRAAAAIITAANSDFTGRINGWFDQVMDRTTQRYAMQARLVTVFGAIIVAFAIQLDSLDLLRRLSVDDKLRSSLVQEANAQDARIDALSKADAKQVDAKNELETATATRNEIQQNLSRLRAPDMAILPDHFMWQRVPRASLVRNPLWKPPYPAKFELVTGGGSWVVSPRWRRDALRDLKEAIDNAKAPVTASIEPGADLLLITAKKPAKIELFDANGRPLLTPLIEASRACLVANPDWPDQVGARLHLFLDDSEQAAFTLVAGRQDVLSKSGALLQSAGAPIAVSTVVLPDASGMCVTALDSRVRRIGLLTDEKDPFSNILDNTELITRAGTVPAALVGNRKVTLKLDGKPVDVFDVFGTKEADPVSVRRYRAEVLVVRSQNLGKLELRYGTGKAETNILDGAVDSEWAIKSLWPVQPAFWGIVLSWLLLSLGAPFWYDALKDLLKLRSSLAGKEEDQREDRQSETPVAATK